MFILESEVSKEVKALDYTFFKLLHVLLRHNFSLVATIMSLYLWLSESLFASHFLLQFLHILLICLFYFIQAKYLKLLNASDNQKANIVDYMDQTYVERRNLIDNGLYHLNAILTAFPHLKAFQGEMVSFCTKMAYVISLVTNEKEVVMRQVSRNFDKNLLSLCIVKLHFYFLLSSPQWSYWVCRYMQFFHKCG